MKDETKCYCGHTTYCDCGPETIEDGVKLQQERSYSEEDIKPIHKFNNGRGAMLCNKCRTIISTGPATKELYCEKCKPKEK